MSYDSKEDLIDKGFKDSIATVDKEGKRIWIYPKKPKGKFYNYRSIVSYVLLIILFALPWIKIQGRQFVQFNLADREFTLFGVYFAPQDFHLFVIAMLIGVIFITLFTVIFGRIFCGWICPQTIFMEMVFRKVEYWIEGDYNKQKRLNNSPWTNEKIIKKVSKQLIFFLISLAIAHTFLAYIIGTDGVIKIIQEPLSTHWQGFIAMIIFTFLFWGVFSVLREQVCTTICPYGRMQGVLLDNDSLVVAYDFERGEPRGKIKRKKKAAQPSIAAAVAAGTPINTVEEEKGDCIDCGLCVRVCPTGIDIRNGTQLECVNCTACMDACDEIMDKIDKPRGLVRIDSYNNILGKHKKFWTPRIMAYSAVLIALLGLEVFLFASRSEVEALLLRTPGMTYVISEDGKTISNLYNYQLVNKTSHETPVRMDVLGFDNEIIEFVGNPPSTIANNTAEGAVWIRFPRETIDKRKTKLKVNVYSADDKVLDEVKTTFLGPF